MRYVVLVAVVGLCGSGAPPGSPWSSSTSGGTVSVAGNKSHGGARSVRVTTNGQAAYRRSLITMGTPFFPVAGNAFYGRMWIFLTAAPAMTTHWNNVQA